MFVGFVVLCAIAYFGLGWPAMVYHGYTATGGWRWDVHSTIACAIWWGILAVIGGVLFLADRFGKASRAKTLARLAAPQPPVCTHRDYAVPVDNLLGGEPWAWLCPKETGGCGAQLPANWKPSVQTCCCPDGRHTNPWACPGRKEPLT